DPIDGWVPTTMLDGLPETPDGVSPADCNAASACCPVSPFTLGPVVVGGAVEITSPLGTVVLDWLFCVAVSPTACNAACAWANVYDCGMLGTVAGSCPRDGTSAMVEPYGALVGFWVEPIDHRTSTLVGTLLLYAPGAHTDLKCAV